MTPTGIEPKKVVSGGTTTWYLVATVNPTGYPQVVEETHRRDSWHDQSPLQLTDWTSSARQLAQQTDSAVRTAWVRPDSW